LIRRGRGDYVGRWLGRAHRRSSRFWGSQLVPITAGCGLEGRLERVGIAPVGEVDFPPLENEGFVGPFGCRHGYTRSIDERWIAASVDSCRIITGGRHVDRQLGLDHVQTPAITKVAHDVGTERVVTAADRDRNPGHRNLQIVERQRKIAEFQTAIDVDDLAVAGLSHTEERQRPLGDGDIVERMHAQVDILIRDQVILGGDQLDHWSSGVSSYRDVERHVVEQAAVADCDYDRMPMAMSRSQHVAA
jgi:hypothetical protein